MIKVDKVEEGLPVSVIVPLSKSRKDFFDNMVLPLIEANDVMEIIINDNDGLAPKKRNDGFKKSTQPFVFFCDDDILLPKNYIKSLYDALVKNPKTSFSYTGYQGIVLNPATHPMHGNFQIPSRPFNSHVLRGMNYISTMSLIRREEFPMFDESLLRLQDWDVWLTIVKNGGSGVLVPNLKFFAFYLDDGITSNGNDSGLGAIRRKHSL
jgi:glycosyltransferase involved in cell wall biosynthesis